MFHLVGPASAIGWFVSAVPPSYSLKVLPFLVSSVRHQGEVLSLDHCGCGACSLSGLD